MEGQRWNDCEVIDSNNPDAFPDDEAVMWDGDKYSDTAWGTNVIIQ